MSDDLTTGISNATNTEEISALLHAEQNAAESDREPRTKVEPEAEEPQILTRTEAIGGKQFIFEAETELELERMVANAYRVATAVQEPVSVEAPTAQVDPAKVAVEQAELEIFFRNGSLSAKEYLERSGAIAEYFEKQGVPVEELKETVEQSRNAKFTQSWSAASEQFLHSPAGADWPGGERNKKQLGLLLNQMNLVDADDKVAAIAQAYAEMKTNDMVFDVPESSQATQRRSQESRPVRQSQQTTAAATATRQDPARRRASSSLFGQSSGTLANDIQDRSREPQKVSIPGDASPQEILEHWKQEQLRQGIDPNAAFQSTFSRR